MGGRGASYGGYRGNVEKAERSIRNESVEHMIMLDKNGNIALRTSDNNKSTVTMSAEMVAMARDAVFTHNHPSGATFSSQDVETAFRTGMKEIRATAPDGSTVSLRRNWSLDRPQDPLYKSFGFAYWQRTQGIRDSLLDRINSGELTIEQANRAGDRMQRDWLKQNAGRFGWTYTEERRK